MTGAAHPVESRVGPDSVPAPVLARRSGRGADVAQVDAWKAVIGEKNSAYYLARFEQMSRPGAPRIAWHWPALLGAGYWLLYRKMWGWAAAYLLFPALLMLGDGLVAYQRGQFQVTLDSVGLALAVVYLLLPGALGNWLYLQHCNRLILRTRRNLPRHQYLRRLARRGGTSDSAAMAAVVLSALAVAGVTAGLGVAVYDDYGKQLKVVEALKLGAVARAAVGEFVSRQGKIPATLQAAGLRLPALPPFVSRLKIDPLTGTIEMGTQLSKAEIGVIYLVPETDQELRIVWSCHVDPVIEPFAPRSCRRPN